MSQTSAYRIAIVGGGTAGWMAAAILARFLPERYQIELVESESIGTVGVGEATIPQIRHFNAALDIDEAEFIAATKATFKLGIAFDGWREPDHTYMHAFGQVGRSAGIVPFHQLWLRAQAEGIARTLDHYSLNEMAARTLRMPPQGRVQGGNVPYAYHFDAALYATFLRDYAERRGVTRTEGRIERVELDSEGGDIRALVLDEDRRAEADFFIDCTGFRALLICDALGIGFEDWTHWLPSDSAVAVPCLNGGDFTPYTRSIARKAGWQWRIPLQHRIGNGHVYSSAHMSDDEAAAILLDNLDGEPTGDPRQLRFKTGKRQRQWHRNCLAIGLAAGFMEPLESTSIHLIQTALSRFLDLVPAGKRDDAAIDHFNSQAEFEWSRVRDFLVLHYFANGRENEPFWDQVREMELPETLTAKLAQWRATGHMHREREELFTEVGWFQVLAGQGVQTEGYSPLADRMSREELMRLLAGTEKTLVEIANTIPSHAETVQRVLQRAGQKDAAA